MTSKSYIEATTKKNLFGDSEPETIKTLSALRTHLLDKLGPQSKEAESVILFALNNDTAQYDDQDEKRRLAVVTHLVINANNKIIDRNIADIIKITLENRDRSKAIVIKEVSLPKLGQTLFIGSISDRAYMLVVIADNVTLTNEKKGILQNELYAFARFIQNAYDTLYPFWEGTLRE